MATLQYSPLDSIFPQLPVRMISSFERRGFRLDRPTSRALLEGHARAFLTGYNCATRSWAEVHDRLDAVDLGERGFAYEGAAMFAHQVDRLTRGRAGRLAALAQGPGAQYPHLIYVGAGWAFTPFRLPWAARLPETPLVRWLAVDGAGFAEAFFGGHRAAWRRIQRARSARDEILLTGVGRALWFLECADPAGVADIVRRAPGPARGPLWSGVGLAVAYAGGADETEVATLIESAGPHVGHLGQGVAFAATARSRAGEIGEPTAGVVRQVLSAEPSAVARWADETSRDLQQRDDLDAYQIWRARLHRAAWSRMDARRHASRSTT